jgi:hypothetical protein
LGSQTDATNLKYILRVRADELEKAATIKGFYGELGEAVRPYGGIEGYVQHQFEEANPDTKRSSWLQQAASCTAEHRLDDAAKEKLAGRAPIPGVGAAPSRPAAQRHKARAELFGVSRNLQAKSLFEYFLTSHAQLRCARRHKKSGCV